MTFKLKILTKLVNLLLLLTHLAFISIKIFSGMLSILVIIILRNIQHDYNCQVWIVQLFYYKIIITPNAPVMGLFSVLQNQII